MGMPPLPTVGGSDLSPETQGSPIGEFPVAPGCARRKYPKEEGLRVFKTNTREFMEFDHWSAFSAPGTEAVK